ncbi:MAG: hypothetical protein JSV53_09965 [candidate division WOR-3 bacterium]|nr:MAG: hypothetical protein JSV53_09965 [candidate division WOR-3 bacterium]
MCKVVVCLMLIVTARLCTASYNLTSYKDAEVDWNRLLDGEVMVEGVETKEGLRGVRAMFTVAASRKLIWEVLTDYENYPEIFEGLDSIKVLEQDDNGAIVEFWNHVFKEYHFVLHRLYEAPGSLLKWRKISGDMKRIEGSWEIRDTPQAGVRLLIYESYVEIGGLFGGLVTWFVWNAAKGEARKMGRRLRDWIEKSVSKD